MIRPVHRDTPWTPEEDDLLRKLARSGESVANIAKHIDRSLGSIRNRAVRLNIALVKFRKVKDMPGK